MQIIRTVMQIIKTKTPSGKPVYMELPDREDLTAADRDWITKLVVELMDDAKEDSDAEDS